MLQEKPSAPQKGTSKLEISSHFSIFVGDFCPSWTRIGFPNADPPDLDPADQNQCGSMWIRIRNAANRHLFCLQDEGEIKMIINVCMMPWLRSCNTYKRLAAIIRYSLYQCSGSMTFWGGSGSGSADLWIHASH
jgi:hypothetical protein